MNFKENRFQIQYDPLLDDSSKKQRSVPTKTGPLQPGISPVSHLFHVSGLYSWKSVTVKDVPETAVPTPPADLSFTWGIGYEALRLDVDGHHPQMLASGIIKNLFHTVHWLAHLESVADNTWIGEIYSKQGLFPYTTVKITAIRSIFHNQRQLNVSFFGDGLPSRHNTLQFESPTFQTFALAFDLITASNLTSTNHPRLPSQPITIEHLFQQAGLDATVTTRMVTAEAATAVSPWSDQELHDAMQFYWANSHTFAKPHLWVLFANQHKSGQHIGATIYDAIGPNQGQATAVFTNSFLSQSSTNNTQPANWPSFGLTCQQIATALHPPHATPPSSSHQIKPPLPTPDYLADCFSPLMLQALRHTTLSQRSDHAPWYDEQGFTITAQPSLHMELRVNRNQATYEFMEPVILELKLTNLAAYTQWADKAILTNPDSLTLVLKKEGRPARQILPYKRDYQMPQPQQLLPSQSVHDTLFVSAGCHGWYISEPGYYTLHAALSVAGELSVSNQLHFRVMPPSNFVQQYLAQDFFTDDVGRILAFNGSRFFNSGNQVLQEVMARLPLKTITLHAAYALGNVQTHDYKQLALIANQAKPSLQIIGQPSRPEVARQLLYTALVKDADTAISTFGHIRWRQHMEQFSAWLAQQGDLSLAGQTMDCLYQTMSTRSVNGRKIPPAILTALRAKRHLCHLV